MASENLSLVSPAEGRRAEEGRRGGSPRCRVAHRFIDQDLLRALETQSSPWGSAFPSGGEARKGCGVALVPVFVPLGFPCFGVCGPVAAAAAALRAAESLQRG